MDKDLFNNFISGNSNDEENQQLLDQLNRSPEKLNAARKSYFGIVHLLGSSPNKIWLNSRFQHLQQKQRRRMLFLKTSKIAAFLILAAFVGGILTWIHKTPETLKWTTITLQRGECRVIILPDSSQVQLAPASTLSYPLHFGKEQREVHLDGEAYFDVRKDRQKPFIVSTQSSRLEVTGTSFNMSSYSSDDQDVIMLVEGGVKLNFFDQAGAQTGQIELKPYQKAVYDKVSQEVTDSRFRDSDLNDWSHRKLSFRNERFVDLAKTLERYYDVDIIFKNKALQEILLNGDFEKETLIDILETIKLLTPFSYQLDTSTNTIYLSAL